MGAAAVVAVDNQEERYPEPASRSAAERDRGPAGRLLMSSSGYEVDGRIRTRERNF